MAQKISVFIFLFSVLKLVVSQYGCNVNEHVTETVNPCNTCEIRGWCPQSYGPGCDCYPGYLRNSNGICGPPETCDVVPHDTPSFPTSRPVRPVTRCHGSFEEYTECGSACPLTCDKRYGMCIQVCVPGCFCRKGYIRNKEGVCVLPNQCSKAQPRSGCGPNEEYQSCGTACPTTCLNLGKGETCTLQCVPGCFCKKGYVRNDGKCILISECSNQTISSRQGYYIPPYVPPPDVYRPPPGVYRPHPDVYRPHPDVYRPHPDVYRPPFSPQPRSGCGPNEEYQSCGTACPTTCLNLGKGQACTLQCVPGCFCKKGYARNDGKCILISECSNQTISSRRGYYIPPYVPPPDVYRPPPGVYRPHPDVYRPHPDVYRPHPDVYRPPSDVYRPPFRPYYPVPVTRPPPSSFPPKSSLLPTSSLPTKSSLLPTSSLPTPPPPPPVGTRGCPNRIKCNRFCKSAGFVVGFCVGEGFLRCNCMR